MYTNGTTKIVRFLNSDRHRNRHVGTHTHRQTDRQRQIHRHGETGTGGTVMREGLKFRIVNGVNTV